MAMDGAADAGEKFATPKLDRIEACAARIAPHVLVTPTIVWPGTELPGRVGEGTEILAKLELLQRAGSFKARGAIEVMLGLDKAARARGVTAVSAGNHAIAVAWAAARLGISAKVVMHKAANPFRVERCRAFGAEVIQAEDISAAFDVVRRIEQEEGRAFVHPFEGPGTVLGTATVGLEMLRQCDAPGLPDAVIVPVGGGGLIAGIASAVHRLAPDCAVFGVEPDGAAGMAASLAAGRPLAKVLVTTIADSLGAPLHLPLTYALVERHVAAMVQVSDDDLRNAMRMVFRDARLAVEPAAAAAVAALLGPLRVRLAGKRVALVLCGSNIDMESYFRLVG